MKLLNQSIIYLSVALLFIISIWGLIFYVNMLDEIKESVDEGLENYKRQIIFRSQTDSSILSQNNFEEGFFAIQKTNLNQIITAKDKYIDTLMYMQDSDDGELELEPVRMLTTTFENHGNYFELRIINSMLEEDDLIESLLWEIIWLYIVLIASIIIINNFVLKRLWKPFYNFLSQLKEYRLDSSKKLPEVNTKTTEFSDLQNAVNTLLLHSIETYEQQKQFIGNASHELQTPLAIVTNKLELLVERGDLEDAQAESIADIMQIVERMVRLNKSLLLLTKIENKQFFNNQTIHLNSIVHQSIQDLEEFAEFKNIKISVFENAELNLEMDHSLANIIISNLIRNAIFHNISNGTVTIEIAGSSFNICNTGINEPLNPNNIFTKFYKSDLDQKGTGLGLSIVKAICSIYGFSVLYQYEDTKHCFRINFNLNFG